MDFKKHAFILGVVKALHEQSSWTGKTHIQKSLSLLHDSGKVSVPFQFVLYKHGPYSFDIEAELEEMQSYDAVEIKPNMEGYGVVVREGENAKFVKKVESLTEEEVQAIENVCKFVGSRNVTELERLATASWIRAQEHITDTSDVARRLHELKPHILIPDAKNADMEVADWLQEK